MAFNSAKHIINLILYFII